MPQPWEAALLALAAYRVFRVIGFDSIADRPRDWALERLDGKWELFITCPFCAGFWITVGWWLAWLAAGDWALLAATPWALHAGWLAVALVVDPELRD